MADRPDRVQRRAQGRLMRRILSSWVREYERFKEDHTWFEYVDAPAHMDSTARRMLDSAERSGTLGPPAAVTAARRQMLHDLDRARRREVADARTGWRPLEVNVVFPRRADSGRRRANVASARTDRPNRPAHEPTPTSDHTCHWSVPARRPGIRQRFVAALSGEPGRPHPAWRADRRVQKWSIARSRSTASSNRSC